MTTTYTHKDYTDLLREAEGHRKLMSAVERKRLAACRAADRAQTDAAYKRAAARIIKHADEYRPHYDAWKAANDRARAIKAELDAA